MSNLDELLKQIRGDLADLKLRDERGEKVPEAEREAILAAAKNTRGQTKFAPPGASPEHQAAVAARAPDLGGARPVAKVDGFALAHKAGGGLAPAMKALAEGTGSAGGFLVPAETSAEIVGALRARSAIFQMGPRVVPVEKSLAVVRLSTGAAAFYVAENAAIPPSEPTFAEEALLQPKELAALVPVSNRLLRDAAQSPSLDEALRMDLADIMALRADLAFLEGPGGTEPRGIRSTPGLTPAPSLGTNGRTPTYDDLKDMVANLRTANAPFAKPGWVFSPRTLNTLEKVKDSTGRYLGESGLLTFDASGGGGTLLGYPFRTTTQVPVNITAGTSTDTSFIVFGSDWQEAWIGENQALVIEGSSEAAYQQGGTWVSAWQNRQTVFRAVMTHDFALRRPNLFSVMTGVRP